MLNKDNQTILRKGGSQGKIDCTKAQRNKQKGQSIQSHAEETKAG